MRLKTLIKKLEKEREKFIKKYGKEPVIFSANLDWNDELEVTITSKINKDGCLTSTSTKTTEFKVKVMG